MGRGLAIRCVTEAGEKPFARSGFIAPHGLVTPSGETAWGFNPYRYTQIVVDKGAAIWLPNP